MPSLARRSSPAAADPSHTSHSPTPPPSARACPIALTCWAHCRAGFAQLSSSSGLLTWVLAHVGAPRRRRFPVQGLPTPSKTSCEIPARSPARSCAKDPAQDPVQTIPCKIRCYTPPHPLAAASTPSVAVAIRRRRHPSPPPSVAAAGHLHNCHLPLRRRPAKHASYHAPPLPQDHPSLGVWSFIIFETQSLLTS